MTDKSLFPADYSVPQKSNKYLNKLPQGETRIRFLSEVLTGWCDWSDNKPVRTKDEPEFSVDPERPARHFWAVKVFSYEDESVKVMEISQSSIQNAIMGLHNSADWGPMTAYDIIINRTGEQLNTKYEVNPVPPKKLEKAIQDYADSIYVNLEALFTGEDPFLDAEKEKALNVLTK